jgi:predicted LPLAT superfamily acyltransferase
MDGSSVTAETSADSSRWSRVTERGSLWGLRFTVWCYRRLGRGPVLVLIPLVVGYFFLTDRTGRRASAAYLRRVRATPAGRGALGTLT